MIIGLCCVLASSSPALISGSSSAVLGLHWLAVTVIPHSQCTPFLNVVFFIPRTSTWATSMLFHFLLVVSLPAFPSLTIKQAHSGSSGTSRAPSLLPYY